MPVHSSFSCPHTVQLMFLQEVLPGPIQLALARQVALGRSDLFLGQVGAFEADGTDSEFQPGGLFEEYRPDAGLDQRGAHYDAAVAAKYHRFRVTESACQRLALSPRGDKLRAGKQLHPRARYAAKGVNRTR